MKLSTHCSCANLTLQWQQEWRPVLPDYLLVTWKNQFDITTTLTLFYHLLCLWSIFTLEGGRKFLITALKKLTSLTKVPTKRQISVPLAALQTYSSEYITSCWKFPPKPPQSDPHVSGTFREPPTIPDKRGRKIRAKVLESSGQLVYL